MKNSLIKLVILSMAFLFTGCSLLMPKYSKIDCDKSCQSKGFNSSTCLYSFDATANLELNAKCKTPKETNCYCYNQNTPKSAIPKDSNDEITLILNDLNDYTEILFTMPSPANIDWDLGDEVNVYKNEINGKQIKYIGNYDISSIDQYFTDRNFNIVPQGYRKENIVCKIIKQSEEIDVQCGKLIEKPEIISLKELLNPENNLINKDLKISGFVNKLGESEEKIFELVNGDYKINIWYNELNDPSQADFLLNRHLVHLAGELVSYGDNENLPEFKVYNLQIIE